MAENTLFDPGCPLAPSELVLLHGEKFAKKTKAGGVQLLGKDIKVADQELAQVLLAVGFLACEQSGAIRLEMRPEEAAPDQPTHLYVVPTGEYPPLPAPSLEFDIQEIAGMLNQVGQETEVSDIIYTWLRQDSQAPWQTVVDFIQEGMASRGLLDKAEEKGLQESILARLGLPDSTASIAAEQPIEPVKQLLKDCSKSRAEVWKTLEQHINHSLESRHEEGGAEVAM
ncbi:MAG: hypothetical protein PVF70_06195 [Anaerolineales bacterium]|jgi:hypothetical protein